MPVKLSQEEFEALVPSCQPFVKRVRELLAEVTNKSVEDMQLRILFESVNWYRVFRSTWHDFKKVVILYWAHCPYLVLFSGCIVHSHSLLISLCGCTLQVGQFACISWTSATTFLATYDVQHLQGSYVQALWQHADKSLCCLQWSTFVLFVCRSIGSAASGCIIDMYCCATICTQQTLVWSRECCSATSWQFAETSALGFKVLHSRTVSLDLTTSNRRQVGFSSS